LQLIRGERAIGEIAFMDVNSAMFTYVKIVVVLMYFIERGRIEAIEGEIQPSDWPELSENQCARTNSSLAAAERICHVDTNTKLIIHGAPKLPS
jgi:hypothetical protein